MSIEPAFKIAFVLPWYGESAVGGAETEARHLAHHLSLAGMPVEVLTTCAKDSLSGWSKDYYKEGEYLEGRIRVRRFRVDRRPLTRFHEVNLRLMRGKSVSAEEEELFMTEIVNSSRLYSYIQQCAESHLFVFIPYPFGTTYWGSKIAPSRSFLIPCLHDEGYARMSLMSEMFARFRKILFHSLPEMALARRLYGLDESRLFLLGEGIDTNSRGDAASFRSSTGISGPFVLYVGRRAEGKNTPLLINYFCRFVDGWSEGYPDLKLALAGKGPLMVPAEYEDRVVDLGFLPEEMKLGAYAAATVCCQPSVNESFSIAVMESWAQGTPVLVHAGCDVTKDHCLRANGGLYFGDYAEFEGCLAFLLENPAVRHRMGEFGQQYVRANSSWEKVVQRFVAAVHDG